MAGFVYVMSNPAMPNLLKIGKSDRDPKMYRKHELETTGVPDSFKVEYYAFVDDHNSVEEDVHSDLSKYRNKPNREFFKCSVMDAVFAIQSNGKIKYEEIYFVPKTDQTPVKNSVPSKREEEVEKELMYQADLKRLKNQEKEENENRLHNRFYAASLLFVLIMILLIALIPDSPNSRGIYSPSIGTVVFSPNTTDDEIYSEIVERNISFDKPTNLYRTLFPESMNDGQILEGVRESITSENAPDFRTVNIFGIGFMTFQSSMSDKEIIRVIREDLFIIKNPEKIEQ